MFDKLRALVSGTAKPEPTKAAPQPQSAKSIRRGEQLHLPMGGAPYLPQGMSLGEGLLLVLESPWTLAAIEAQQRRINQLEPIMQQWDPEAREWTKFEGDHPALERLDRPAPWLTRTQFFDLAIFSKKTSGNFFAAIIRSDRKVDGVRETLALEPLDSDGVFPIPDELDMYAGYKVQKTMMVRQQSWSNLSASFGWSTSGFLSRPVPLEDMIHDKYVDPKNPLWGKSPLQTAAAAIQTEIHGIRWNLGKVKNRPGVGGILETEQPMTDLQIDEAKERLKERFTGLNAHETMILTRGLKWHSGDNTLVEMDYVNSDRHLAYKICACIGTPPQVIGIDQYATLSNVGNYMTAFYTDTIIPEAESIYEALNSQWVWPDYGTGVRLWFDTSKVPALQEDRDSKLVVFRELYGMGYPANILNQWLELGLPDIPTGNISFVSPSLVPMGFVGPDGRSINLVTDPVTGPEQPLLPESTDTDNPPDAEPMEDRDDLKSRREIKSCLHALSKANPAQYAKAFDETRVPFEEKWARKLKGQIRERLMAAARRVSVSPLAMEDELERSSGGLKETLTELWVDVANSFGEAVFTSLKSAAKKLTKNEPDIDEWGRSFTENISPYIQAQTAEAVRRITFTQKMWMKAQLAIHYAEGLSLDAFADRIMSLGSAYSEQRSQVIARTEVVSASNYGGQKAAKDTGLVAQKEWADSGDGRVRDSHEAMNGERVGLDARYSNGAEFPGDPNLPAKERILCRCVELYHVGD